MNPDKLRVLILTASQADSTAAVTAVIRNGYKPQICSSAEELCREL